MSLSEFLYKHIDRVVYNLTLVMVKSITQDTDLALKENSELPIRLIWCETFIFCLNMIIIKLKLEEEYKKEDEYTYSDIEKDLHQIFVNGCIVDDLLEEYKEIIVERYSQYSNISKRNIKELIEFYQNVLVYDVSNLELYRGTIAMFEGITDEVFCKREIWSFIKSIDIIISEFFTEGVSSFIEMQDGNIVYFEHNLQSHLNRYDKLFNIRK